MVRMKTDFASSHPFNSTLETGIRALVVLEALHPRRCDLLEITWLDHLVVHTGDFEWPDAPNSLHPDLPNRAAEVLVRRQLVKRSLLLMQRMHLIDICETEAGIEYSASEDAPSYVDLLQAPYSKALKDRAKWMAEHFSSLPSDAWRQLINSRIGRWTVEFKTDDSNLGLSQ